MEHPSRFAAFLVFLLTVSSHAYATGYQKPSKYTTITRHKTITLCRSTKTVTSLETYTAPGKVATITQTQIITPITTTTSISTVIQVALSTTTTETVSRVSTVPAPAMFQGVRESLPEATFNPAFLAGNSGQKKRSQSADLSAELLERATWPEDKWWKRNYKHKDTKTVYTTKMKTIYRHATSTKISTITIKGSPRSTITVTSTSTAPASISTVVTTSNVVPPVFTKTETSTSFTATEYAACNPSNMANAFTVDDTTYPVRRYVNSGPAQQHAVLLGDVVADGTACCNLLFSNPFAVEPDPDFNPTGQPASAALFAWDSDSRACMGFYHWTYNCSSQMDPMNSAQLESRSRPDELGMVVGNGPCGFIDGYDFRS